MLQHLFLPAQAGPLVCRAERLAATTGAATGLREPRDGGHRAARGIRYKPSFWLVTTNSVRRSEPPRHRVTFLTDAGLLSVDAPIPALARSSRLPRVSPRAVGSNDWSSNRVERTEGRRSAGRAGNSVQAFLLVGDNQCLVGTQRVDVILEHVDGLATAAPGARHHVLR